MPDGAVVALRRLIAAPPAGSALVSARKRGRSASAAVPLSTTWPKELLARLNVKEGDQLFVIETRQGVMVTPYDPQFELGRTLRDSAKTVSLNHPHCAKFCVLGGAACSRS